MVQEKIKNTMEKFNIVNNPKIDVLSDSDKNKYKIFMTSILKLATRTKKLINLFPEINNNELPHIYINRLDSVVSTISYSVKENKWLLTENNLTIHFNPTAISGILEFLNNYDIIDIQNSVDNFQDEINELSLKYGINY